MLSKRRRRDKRPNYACIQGNGKIIQSLIAIKYFMNLKLVKGCGQKPERSIRQLCPKLFLYSIEINPPSESLMR